MPRTIPTTTWNDRTKPTSTWVVPRDIEISDPVSFDSTVITFDSTVYTWDRTAGNFRPIATTWDDPRYAGIVEDLDWINIFDLTGESVLWISGRDVNVIDTIWT